MTPKTIPRWIKIIIRRATTATNTIRVVAMAIHQEIRICFQDHAWFARAIWNFLILVHLKSIWAHHIRNSQQHHSIHHQSAHKDINHPISQEINRSKHFNSPMKTNRLQLFLQPVSTCIDENAIVCVCNFLVKFVEFLFTLFVLYQIPYKWHNKWMNKQIVFHSVSLI